MTKKINRIEKNYVHNGFKFEVLVAERLGLRRDGRPDKTDLIVDHDYIKELGDTIPGEIKGVTVADLGTAKRVETKLLNFGRGEDGKYFCHGGHLPQFDKSKPVLDQLRNYCNSFDKFVIAYGNYNNNEYEVLVLNRKEAYEFIKPRLQAQGSDKLRIKPKAGTTKSGGDAQVLETMRKKGWII